MRKLIIICILGLVMVSCASESQQKGLDEISKHYDTKATYTKGFSTKNGNKTTLFTVKVTSNKLLDSLSPSASLTNIALMMFDSFSAEERTAYTNIAVQLSESKTAKDTILYYEPATLAKALDQSVMFDDFSEKVIQQDYKTIVETLRPQYQSEKVLEQLSNYCTGLKEAHGNINNFKRLSSGVTTTNDGEKLFKYIGVFEFADGHKRGYSVTTSMNIKDDYIAGYNIL